jgi:hypothetical protein
VTAALTPTTALAYLGALTAGLDAAVVADVRGNVLAGDAALLPAARVLAAAANGRVARDSELHAASDERHLVAVRCTGATPPGVVAVDIRAVLAGLATTT